MGTIFLSYSSQDYFFAEMLSIKLEESGFQIWRDQGAIRAGDDWRQSIESGIRDCVAVIVALSASSVESPYVTYEWAYAIGMGKPVIPVRLSACKVHPKLEPTQHIDFSYPKVLPWEALVQRLKEIDAPENELSGAKSGSPKRRASGGKDLQEAANAILTYLGSHGFTMASFDRLRDRVDKSMTDTMFDEIIAGQPAVFRHARVKGGKPGIAKRVP